ncbi:MAG: excinuclease ABC subunit UvrB [Candidatus Delongbacteria bacterium]|nr:excinuclease ABC subunit UvrB [Candidatus Delongbacteria bacterium]
MSIFSLQSEFTVSPTQEETIQHLVNGLNQDTKYQTLLGVTGSGKTYIMANVIARLGRPALVISHNKTLAAQLYNEFKLFFPNNAVEYFISYYDYYQPEAYMPTTDTYIEKDTSVNDEIERLRLKATSSLMERRDVIIVASVSCIYGLGSPEDYRNMTYFLKTGGDYPRKAVLKRLIEMYYERNDVAPERGTFRVRGDTIEIYPAYENWGLRLSFFGDELEELYFIDPVTGKNFEKRSSFILYPAKHFITSQERLQQSISSIKDELRDRLQKFQQENKLVEAQRLEQRTLYDLEMIREVGYCSGIENYSRHLSDRMPGERPYTLIDFFPPDYLTFIDESHVTIPQIRGMFAGDRSRKEVLVNYGFRLPSAMDNRPMFFHEFEESTRQALFVSATPGPYEIEKSGSHVIQQLIRPTGLIDPEVMVRPSLSQVDDFIQESRSVVNRGERILGTTLTKKMAEDLTAYLIQLDFRARYLHSEIDALERVEILRGLRAGDYDILIGINLLREGLDLPEVSLVAVFDADKEGFLRSETSLIQTMGRASRHINGRVILYADKITGSMERAIQEANRRRQIQMDYNRIHQIEPRSVKRSLDDSLRIPTQMDQNSISEMLRKRETSVKTKNELEAMISILKEQMNQLAAELEFEKAALLRDEIRKLYQLLKK